MWLGRGWRLNGRFPRSARVRGWRGRGRALRVRTQIERDEMVGVVRRLLVAVVVVERKQPEVVVAHALRREAEEGSIPEEVVVEVVRRMQVAVEPRTLPSPHRRM
jgi:hypothetical protein